MKIYVRKIDQQCITHQISYTQEILSEFLDGQPNQSTIICENEITHNQFTVTLLLATDPRFSNDIKQALVDNGDQLNVDDLMVMKKHSTYYSVELIKQNDPRYGVLANFFNIHDRHLLLNNPPIINSKVREGFNRIYYGCPGCGKSHLVKEMLKSVPKTNVFRVTFHPEYSNYDFVGQVMPISETVQDPNDATKTINVLKYDFQKGPFTLALEKALSDETKMVYLVIEEINRGNAAAIFGDLFQLLDRDFKELNSDGTNNENYLESIYHINNVNIQDELGIDNVFIPSNLAIIGTMNTSDQNVFTLDTAFKRRWEFVYVENTFTADDAIGELYVPGTNVKWSRFVEEINKKITNQLLNDAISDDKRIGKYFINEALLESQATTLKDGQGNIDQALVEKAKKFAYKVLEYIWDDVAKYDAKKEWFDTTSCHTLEELIASFIDTKVNNPLAVFIDGLF